MLNSTQTPPLGGPGPLLNSHPHSSPAAGSLRTHPAYLHRLLNQEAQDFSSAPPPSPTTYHLPPTIYHHATLLKGQISHSLHTKSKITTTFHQLRWNYNSLSQHPDHMRQSLDHFTSLDWSRFSNLTSIRSIYQTSKIIIDFYFSSNDQNFFKI